MTFNYGLEKKKFDEAWAALAEFYEKCGMDPDSIEAMYEFDWKAFKAARIEALHTQDMAIPEDSTADDELDSQLLKKFPEQFTSSYDTYGSHSRYWWLEELDNPCLAFGVRLMTDTDKELLTLYILEQRNIREIASMLHTSKSDVQRMLRRIFSLFSEHP